MKVKTNLVTSLVALSALLLTGCPKVDEPEYRVTGDYLTGKLAKRDYKAYLGSAPTTLDATKSQSAENITHLANFEDCLVMNDSYGVLRRSLAATATRDASKQVFTFTIKEGIPWITADGSQYVYRNTPQFVKAEDFVTTAKQVLNYNNNSEIYYMYTLFINNAWEYYCYTMMAKRIADQYVDEKGFHYDTLQNNMDAQATKLTELVRELSNQDPDTEITGSVIGDIKDFKRVGVSAKNGVLTYTLNQPADFFPTMLTYTPYTPINSHFLAAHKNDYGTKKDTILYCGPFILDELSSETVRYKKNEQYWDKDSVHIDTVEYQIADSSLGYADMRTSFDQGKVDGFSLSIEDETGWNMYIKGPDGTGTIQNPASDLVNSRELDDVDYTYHMILNTNRSTDESSYINSPFYIAMRNAKHWDDADIQADILNSNKAFKLREVRKMILDGINLEIYNENYHAPERDQYQINTFTPRGYVFDGAGVDYIDYYYSYYAVQKGLVSPSATEAEKVAAGKEAVGPQQIKGVQLTQDAETIAKYPWLDLNANRERAKAAVDLYNAANPGDQIAKPVNIEYIGVGALNSKSDTNEKAVVQSWNERANGCAIDPGRAAQVGLPTCQEAFGTADYPYFYMRLSQPGSQDKLQTIVENGRCSIYTGWGWIGDYADPLTYVHCYVTNGEMSKMSGNNTLDLDNWRLNDEGTVITKDSKKLFEQYNLDVIAANNQRDSLTARYQEFAKVEYELLNDLYVMKPLSMHTQGWAASVSRAAGYENPQAHYGLADNILKGMWVLVDVPTGAERKQCRELQNQRKAEAMAAVGGNAINGAFM